MGRAKIAYERKKLTMEMLMKKKPMNTTISAEGGRVQKTQGSEGEGGATYYYKEDLDGRKRKGWKLRFSSCEKQKKKRRKIPFTKRRDALELTGFRRKPDKNCSKGFPKKKEGRERKRKR